MQSLLLCIWEWFTKDQNENENAITAISTAGLLLITIAIAIIAYITYKGAERFNRNQGNENTIFKLLEFHSVGHREMNYFFPEVDKRVYGTEAFDLLYKELKRHYEEHKIADTKIAPKELIRKAFQELYDHHSQIGAYYKNLYLLVNYIDKTVKTEMKGTYISILKARLTSSEILLLPYDCIWIEGDRDENDEFTTLTGKYNLLSALERDRLIDSKNVDIFKSKNLIK